MGFNLGFKGLNSPVKSHLHLLALLGAHHIFHVSGLRVNCPSPTQNSAVTLKINHRRINFLVNFHSRTVHLDIIKVLLPTDAQENCFNRSIKIYIKTAPTCFGVITIIRERTI